MKRFICLLFLIFAIISCCASDISFYGDVMLSRGIEKFVRYQGMEPVTNSLNSFLSKSIVNVINLEGSLSNNEGSTIDSELCFSIQPEMMNLLKKIQVVSLQNNHSLDAGISGYVATIDRLKLLNIKPLGGDDNPTVIRTDQGDVGIIAVTDILNYHSGNKLLLMADNPSVIDKIIELKKKSSAVFVFAHWGRELLPVVTEQMKKYSSDYSKAGADVVVGAHPHVVCPVETINGKPAVYSLGNFLFDQKYPLTKKGAILNCDINEEGILQCYLTICETPVNSFLPNPGSSTELSDQNKLIKRCILPLVRKWSGHFTTSGVDETLELELDPIKKGLWKIVIRAASSRYITATPGMPVKKLQPVDLDDDGVEELMLLQTIYSKFDKEISKRVYIYSFKDGFHALWRGTALSRPLIDAVFVKKGSVRVLAALHSADSFILRDKKCTKRVVTCYRWNGFGFTGINEISVEDNCDKISLNSGGICLSEEGVVKKVISHSEMLF